METSTADGSGFYEYIELLRSLPDSKSLQECLSVLLNRQKSPSEELQVILVILDTTIPQVYLLASGTIKNLIVKILQSVRGIGGLLNKIMYVLNADIPLEVLGTYIDVLTHVFNGSLLQSIITDKPFEINEVNKLLFRGQALSIVNEARVKNQKLEDLGVLETSDGYISYLLLQLLLDSKLDEVTFNKYFLSLLSVNESGYLVIFDTLFGQTHWPRFLQHYIGMKQFEKKKLVGLVLKYIHRRSLLEGDDYDRIDAVFNVVEPIFEISVLDGGIVETILSLQSRPMNILVSILINKKAKDQKQWCDLLLNKWGDISLMKSEPIALQEFRTHFLIQFIHLQPRSLIEQLTSSAFFLDGVSNRFNSYSNPLKVFAITLADKICELSKRDKIFLMTDLEGYDYLLADSSYHYDLRSFDMSTSWSKVSEPIIAVEDEIHTEKSVSGAMAELNINKVQYYKDSDDESEEDSDDEDDPTVVQRIKIPRPIYITELVKYLRVDSKNPQAYDMMNLALKSGPTLIRQKAQFGVELKSNSNELMQVLISLNNDFAIEGFDDLRLNSLISILVSDPDCGREIIQMLGTGDYSLQQRMVILSALSLAARDIRGFKDEAVTKAYKEKQFPTKELPQNLHQMYLGLEKMNQNSTNTLEYEPQSLHNAYLSIQDSLMHEDSEEAKDQLLGGKVLRMSRKLLKTPEIQSLTPRFKNYSSIISKSFYFPLVYLWHESGGINIGHYSSLLTGHYIKTMALLIHCSIASIANNDMIREFLIVAVDVIKNTQVDQVQVIEGLVTGLLLICDISDEQYLLINFGQYLIPIQTWLNDIWESIIDNRLKSLCAGFLLRLTKILDKYQATMVDQMNNIY